MQGDIDTRRGSESSRGIHVYCPAQLKEELRLLSELNMMDSSQVVRIALRLYLEYLRKKSLLPIADCDYELEDDPSEAAENEEDPSEW